MYRKISILVRGTVGALALSLGFAGAAEAQNEGTTVTTAPERAVTRVGTRGALFLQLPVGARANALAGAGAVVTDGIDGLYWNPAAAGEVESLTGGLSYMEVYGGTGVEHRYLGMLLPLLGGTIGVTVNSLTSGDIPRTQEFTPSGDNTGTGNVFDWTTSAIGLTYGRRITDRLVAGATVKQISEGIQGARANWMAADVGVRFITGLYGTTVAGSIVNIGGSARMEGNLISANVTAAQEVFEVERAIAGQLTTHGAALPTAFQFGIALDLLGGPQALLAGDPRHNASLLFDIRDANDANMQPIVAFEYGFNEMGFIRFGKQWANDSFADHEFSHGLSGGLGLRVNAFQRRVDLDYGYMNLGVLNNRHVFSFQFTL
jgi:hypothetical protein